VTSDQARCITFRKVIIESETSFSIQMDGEPMLGTQQAMLRVRPRALKVLMPPQSLALLSRPPVQAQDKQ